MQLGGGCLEHSIDRISQLAIGDLVIGALYGCDDDLSEEVDEVAQGLFCLGGGLVDGSLSLGERTVEIACDIGRDIAMAFNLALRHQGYLFPLD